MRCPDCGSEDVKSKGTKRRVILTTYGRVELGVRRRRCQPCRQGFCPAEACLKTLAGKNVTRALQEACSEAGASWPYATAAQVLHRLCGAQISPEEVRLVTNARGWQEAERQARKAQQRVEPSAADVRADRERKDHRQAASQAVLLLVGLDGGWIKSREQPRGMEGKVAVVSSESIGKHGRHRLTSRRYAATFASSEELGNLASAATCDLQAQDTTRQVVLGDGAPWIKTETTQHFPQAVKIVDWAHLWRVIHKAIRAVTPGQKSAQRTWRQQQDEALRPWLWQGNAQAARTHLETLRSLEQAEPIEALEDAITSLESQREWMGNYEQWRQQGYPVGSGMIERGVAVVINPRMKRRGMRWKRCNATAVVALRVRALNAQWDEASARRRAA